MLQLCHQELMTGMKHGQCAYVKTSAVDKGSTEANTEEEIIDYLYDATWNSEHPKAADVMPTMWVIYE
jgi:hypothetical protein